MKISFIKSKSDLEKFKIANALGMDVYEITDLENVDNKINELIANNFNTIILSKEISGFSGIIAKKDPKNKNINFIIV